MLLDEARGIAAKIWCLPNNRRRVMDAQLCEDFANLLIDEVAKISVDDTHLRHKAHKAKVLYDELQIEQTKLQDRYKSLNDQYERLKVENTDLETKLKAFDNLVKEKDALTEQLKAAEKKDEVV